MSDLETLLKDLRKKYEDDYIVITSDLMDSGGLKVVPTGSLNVDAATGVGGIPLGRITELYGVESSGKTTLCQHIVANAQKMGLTCAYIDTEQALDPDYMEICGVDLSKLLISQPDTMNTALALTEDFINSGQINLIVFDSVVGISTDSEKEKELGERTVSSIAGLLTQYFRRNMPGIRENNVGVIFTNQARDVIGSYVPMIGTTGGHALKHYSSLRIQTKKSKDIKQGDDIIGTECEVNFKKNKVGGFPGKVATYNIIYGKGIYRPADVVQAALDYGVLVQRGAWINYNKENVAQGKQNLIDLLATNTELLDKIESDTRKAIGEYK